MTTAELYASLRKRIKKLCLGPFPRLDPNWPELNKKKETED